MKKSRRQLKNVLSFCYFIEQGQESLKISALRECRSEALLTGDCNDERAAPQLVPPSPSTSQGHPQTPPLKITDGKTLLFPNQKSSPLSDKCIFLKWWLKCCLSKTVQEDLYVKSRQPRHLDQNPLSSNPSLSKGLLWILRSRPSFLSKGKNLVTNQFNELQDSRVKPQVRPSSKLQKLQTSWHRIPGWKVLLEGSTIKSLSGTGSGMRLPSLPAKSCNRFGRRQTT